MLKRVLLWCIILLPTFIAGAMLLLLATAFMVIRITNDGEAFAKAVEPLQALARDVYERQRSIWQAQNECIMFDEGLFYKPRPGGCIFNNVEFTTTLSFDDKGVRRSSPVVKPDGKMPSGRIVVLGDSQAMGWGVQDGETFASVLAAEHGFEVANLAVASYGTARELLRLRREFELQSGDIVVIQYHPNDLQENLAFLNPGGLPARSPADLKRLAHTPQRYQLFQVSASIAFILKGKVIKSLLSDGDAETESGSIHAESFLSVVGHFPELAQVRLVVCEVNNFGRISSYAEDLQRRSRKNITVLEPRWESSDFFRLDPHLNSSGHRKLAGLIAASVRSGSDS